MKTRHTQGPWEASPSENPHNRRQGGWDVFGKSDDEYNDDGIEMVAGFLTESNSRLIAAAPDMLKRLRYVIDWLEDSKVHADIVAHCKADVAKAVGDD